MYWNTLQILVNILFAYGSIRLIGCVINCRHDVLYLGILGFFIERERFIDNKP